MKDTWAWDDVRGRWKPWDASIRGKGLGNGGGVERRLRRSRGKEIPRKEGMEGNKEKSSCHSLRRGEKERKSEGGGAGESRIRRKKGGSEGTKRRRKGEKWMVKKREGKDMRGR